MELNYRLLIFITLLVTMTAVELVYPFIRLQARNQQQRWRIKAHNLLLVIISSGLIRLVFPWGLLVWGQYVITHTPLPQLNWLPGVAGYVGTILVFDLLIYWQHRLFHRISWLWRLHRVHHTDTALDATTGFRFHPIEMLLSFAIKCLAIGILAPPLAAILLFEIILSSSAILNHSNIKPPFEQYLRLVWVTPQMHFGHHSRFGNECNHNYGFCIAWWDRLFGTYQAKPQKGFIADVIGDPGQPKQKTPPDFLRLLALPFR
ncbi:MAG: sterol desaturase [Kangiellaceae bacterium]|nr:sterol desaturase [Kangiellaceae bacterium]|tara:strand:- start:14129 stop:14911 length:783 start_codon:yes stop_codon:yes gene_type:complete